MRPQLAPLPALIGAAEATTTLRLGTLVLNLDLRHPVTVAREALTADLLTDGRMELGIGAGWMRSDYADTGTAWERGRQRAERFHEAATLVRRLTSTEEPVHSAGRFYSVEGLPGGPLGPQRPLPLLVGAGGPRMLRTAAGVADIVSLARSMAAGPTPMDGARDATRTATVRKVLALREAAGPRFDELEVNILVTLCEIGPHGGGAVARFAADHGLSEREARDTPQHLVGDTGDVVDQLYERREAYALSYVVVREEDADVFAPVVDKLAGA